ncbi:nuclease-related domain-containing protein [Halomicrobium salinisoli]|uniref:nuclease-related domain-containing protein n=1 Tax=Halomicrobium salinisoli TaxID=2878391 RepID=UPI001CF0066C|nr:nuclease-related domain-containing protein [Halomicrobium salinisoli]
MSDGDVFGVFVYPDSDVSDVNRGLKVYHENDVDVPPSKVDAAKGFENFDDAKFTAVRGDVGESIGYKALREKYPDRDEYTILNEIYLKGDGQTRAEIDLVVVDQDGEVVEMAEVKSVTGSSSTTQVGDAIEDAEDGFVDRTTSQRIEVEDITENADNIERTTIGPADDSGYDINTGLTEAEMNALTEAIIARN